MFPISELCTFISRGISPAYDDEGIPVLSQKCIRDNRVLFEAARITNPSKKKVPSEKLVRLHDVLVNSTGVGTLGRVAQVKKLSGHVAVDSHVSIVRPDPAKIDPLFFGYAMVLNQPKIEAMGEGATGQTELSRTRLGAETYVALPPLPIQRRIAGILSAYDELMENSQRRIEILEAMARALYREWFVHFRFPGHESISRVPSPLGDIPHGWEVKPFSGLATYVNGYAFKPDDWGKEGKPIIKIKELKVGVTADTPRNSGERISEKYKVRDGDVLFSWSADLDAYLWMNGEGLLNQHLFNVLPFKGISHAFCFHALKEAMPRFRALSLGATMHHIKRSALDQVSAVVAPEILRQQFDVLVGPVHEQLINLAKKVNNLRRARDLLLPRLLSGQTNLEGV